jgi:CheY-like chemotaxis protein
MRLEDATILVVDDEADLREIFAAWLNRNGCTVLTASNGVEALSILETAKVDVLLSDIRMPIMGGVELVRKVFERKLVVPSVIFVSGFGDVHPREMYGLGVEALMEKPLRRKDLLRVLDDSLMERDQLWRTPSAEPMAQNLTLEMDSLSAATQTCEFQLGRGGCCLTTQRALDEEKTIDLSIHFAQEDLLLRAQGTVRWYEQVSPQAGVEFQYLYPSCRDWVLDAIRERMTCSFIPGCDWDVSRALAARSGALQVSSASVREVFT